RADGGLLDRGRARPPEFADVPPLRVAARRGGLRTGRGGAVFAQPRGGAILLRPGPGHRGHAAVPEQWSQSDTSARQRYPIATTACIPDQHPAELWSATVNRTLSEANMGPGSGTLAKIRRRSQQILTGSELTCSRVRTTTSSLRRKEFNDESRTASPARSRDLRIRVPVLLE